MQIDTLLKRLEAALLAKKWVIYSKGIFYIRFVNKTIFDTPINFDLPIKSNARDFAQQLLLCIDILIQIDESWKNEAIIKHIIPYLKLYQLQFSKVKNKWIITEPNSKYIENEIPNIYIP